MEDLIIDTNILGEFICQYFNNKVFNDGVFHEEKFLSKKIAEKLNAILFSYRTENLFDKGLVIVSSFAFIELSRKFGVITANKINIQQFRAFINDPPEWLVISEIDETTVPQLVKVPKFIFFENRKESIEWADAIHCAAYFSRDFAKMATSDNTIKLIEAINFID